MAPYRQIVEVNMPASYFVEQAGMNVFGDGAAGWRSFDFALDLAALWACFDLLRDSKLKIAGLFAGTFFIAIHMQDGVMMSGERDFVIAVAQVVALALMGRALTRSASQEISTIHAPSILTACLIVVAAFLASLGACQKPTATFFPVATIFWLYAYERAFLRMRLVWVSLLAGLIGPVCLSAAYLQRYGSLSAFAHTASGLIATHSGLERKSFGFLVPHALSPVLPLALLSILTVVVQKRVLGRKEGLFVLCAAAGWVSYWIQGKGFAYQRYPFLIFGLLLLFSGFFGALEEGGPARWVGSVALLASTAMMVLFTLRIARFSHADPFKSLSSDLRNLCAGL
jgi:hypothetical protein